MTITTLAPDIRTRLTDALAEQLGPRKVQLWLDAGTRWDLVTAEQNEDSSDNPEGATDDGRPEDTDGSGSPINGPTSDVDQDGIP
ncbi:MAG: hypothetical protein AAF328_04120, partial [Planctomycetota bacterium]